jgi:hypothetical protein
LDQADDYVGADGRVTVFDSFAERFVIGVGLVVELSQSLGIGMFSGPFVQPSRAEEIVVVD